MWTCSRSLKTATSWWSMSNGFNTSRHVPAHILVDLNRMVLFCLFEAIANATLHPGKFVAKSTGICDYLMHAGLPMYSDT